MWLELVVSVWLVGLVGGDGVGVAETGCGWCGRWVQTCRQFLSFVRSQSRTLVLESKWVLHRAARSYIGICAMSNI